MSKITINWWMIPVNWDAIHSAMKSNLPSVYVQRSRAWDSGRERTLASSGASCPPGPSALWLGHLGTAWTVHQNLTLPVPLPGSPLFGTGHASVHAQFASVVLFNFQNNPMLNQQIAQMAPILLARLSRQYYIESNGNMGPLLAVAAQRLSAANLITIAATFGQANVDSAVASHAPASTIAAYAGATRMALIDRSQARMVVAGISGVTASPNLDMTIYEVSLDYLTAGTDTSVAAALAHEIGAAVDLAISIVSTIVADFTPPTGSEETTATQDDWDWTPH